MSGWTLPKGAIAVPYTPDDYFGEFGWLWTNAHRGDPAEWHLVSTHLPDGKDAEPVITFHAPDGTHPLDEDAADTWAALPYLPAIQPKGSPGAGLEVTVRLDGGASATVTLEDRGARTQRMRRDVMAVLTEGEGPSRAPAHDALRACLAVLYGTLRSDIECACPTDGGAPRLGEVDPEARPFIDPTIAAIREAEDVIGRHMPDGTPGWLATAIDFWRVADAAADTTEDA